MKKIEISAFDLAQRFVGIKEIPGMEDNSQIMAMLRLDQQWPEHDEVAWCSAFMNYIAWLLRLPRSKNLLARSWLLVGRPVPLDQAEPGFDVVILKRDGEDQPGPEVINAKGHVGLFAGQEEDRVLLLGGNQSNSVSVSGYPIKRILGIRCLI